MPALGLSNKAVFEGEILQHLAIVVDRNLRCMCVSICNRMRPSRIKDKFSRVFSKFSQIARVAQRRGQFVKTLKIQVKFILNSTRTRCDYLFITQRAKFSENFPYTLKYNQPAITIIIKVPARKQFTKQAF